MLVKLFRTDRFLPLIFLLATFLIVSLLQVFFGKSTEMVTEGFQSKWLQVLAIFTHLVIAFFLTKICELFDLLNTRSNLIWFSYLLLILLSGSQTAFNFTLLLNLLLVIWLYRLMSLPNSPKAGALIFDAGTIIGILSVMNSILFVLVPVLWIALNFYRSFNLREWTMSLIGLVLPWLYYSVFVFATDDIANLKSILPFYYGGNHYRIPSIVEGGVFLVLMISTLFYLTVLSKNVAVVRKSLYVILMLIFSLILLSFFSEQTLLSLILIPASIIISIFLEQVKKIFFAEALIIIVLSLALYSYYF